MFIKLTPEKVTPAFSMMSYLSNCKVSFSIWFNLRHVWAGQNLSSLGVFWVTNSPGKLSSWPPTWGSAFKSWGDSWKELIRVSGIIAKRSRASVFFWLSWSWSGSQVQILSRDGKLSITRSDGYCRVRTILQSKSKLQQLYLVQRNERYRKRFKTSKYISA